MMGPLDPDVGGVVGAFGAKFRIGAIHEEQFGHSGRILPQVVGLQIAAGVGHLTIQDQDLNPLPDVAWSDQMRGYQFQRAVRIAVATCNCKNDNDESIQSTVM